MYPKYHLCCLHRICRCVGREVVIHLVLVLVISSIDYCNSALAGLLLMTVAPLQHVQNAVVIKLGVYMTT